MIELVEEYPYMLMFGNDLLPLITRLIMSNSGAFCRKKVLYVNPRNQAYASVVLNHYSDVQWKSVFRMTREVYNRLFYRIGPFMQGK